MSHLLKLTVTCLLVMIVTVSFYSLAPRNFINGTQIHIAKNTSLTGITNLLEKNHVISSPILFKVVVTFFYGRRSINAGDYLFKNPQNLFIVAGRLARGDQGLPPIKITIPEGSTVNDIAWILLKKMPDFNVPYFIKIAHDFEGHLFPDTYVLYSNTTPTEVFTTMRKTFDTKIESLSADIKLFGRKFEDVIIMASLLEKEATSSADRAVISGILWKRLDLGMPLQVDPPLAYITSNTSGFISLDDTKIDSPYNTYRYKGLPKGPISNPGLDAISAAIHPVKTPYYFYLSDKQGNMHYATTHEGHLLNRDKYLR